MKRIETLLTVKGIIRTCQENFKPGAYTHLNDVCGCFLDVEEELEGLIDNVVFGNESQEEMKKRRLERINYKLSLYFGTEILNGNPVKNRVGKNIPEEMLKEEDLLVFAIEAAKHTYKNIGEYNNKN